MSLRDRILQNSTIKETAILSESFLFKTKDVVPTRVPMINVALSGKVDGGIIPGLTMISGQSKHFKSGFTLLLASAFLKKYKDGIILFYDSEFGSPESYFASFDIPAENVVHTPVTDIEELKHDISVQLKDFTRKDRVMILVDSIGNLASKKETEDAIEGKTVADMSRAKALKSLFRIVTPKLTLKNIPMVVINHTYKEIGLYPKDIVSGGCVDGETMIRMADNSLSKMADLTVGDFVLTKDGPRKVIATWNPETLYEGTPDRFEVEFEDGYKVIVSENHKFLTINRGWVQVTDLNNYDDLVSV